MFYILVIFKKYYKHLQTLFIFQIYKIALWSLNI